MYKLKKVKTDIKKHLIINNQGLLMVNMNLLKRRIDKFLHENKMLEDAEKMQQEINPEQNQTQPKKKSSKKQNDKETS